MVDPVGRKMMMMSSEDDYLASDELKPKKRLSSSEKANLLGDLKSFALNFKLPSGG